MKQLKSYIKESLLGDEDELVNNEPLLDVYNYIKDHYSTYPDNIGAYNIKKSKSGYIVDVDGNLILKNTEASLTDGSFKFGRVRGYFECAGSKIINLIGAPEIVDKFFDCGQCKELTSLEGGPRQVNGSLYSISYCPKLTTLKGGPEKVEGDFNCGGCKGLMTLEGGPTYVGGNYQAYSCPKLKNLAGVDVVKGYLDIRFCKGLAVSRNMMYISKNINRVIS